MAQIETPAPPGATSSLLDLPPEIRTRIYQYIFDVRQFWKEAGPRKYPESPDLSNSNLDAYPAGTTYIHFHWDETGIRHVIKHTDAGHAAENFFAILETSKLVRKEAIDVFYDQALFKFDITISHLSHRGDFDCDELRMDDDTGLNSSTLRFRRVPEELYLLQHAEFVVELGWSWSELEPKRLLLQRIWNSSNPLRRSTKVTINIRQAVVAFSIHAPNERFYPHVATFSNWLRYSPNITVYVECPPGFSRESIEWPFRTFAEKTCAALMFVEPEPVELEEDPQTFVDCGIGL